MLACRPLLALLLLVILATPACHGNGDTSSPTPSADVTVSEVVEWLLGEQLRGPKTSDRGHVGVVIYDLSSAKPVATVLPNSCAPDLIRLIPTPDRSGTRFAINRSGQLLRYTGDGWSPVSSAKPLPLLDELVAFSIASSRLQLLVRLTGKPRRLALLIFEDDAVAMVEPVQLATFHHRRQTLQRYDSGRCLEGMLGCLHLATTSGNLVIMREPTLFDHHQKMNLPIGNGARDIRYSDSAGSKLDVLTTDVCTPAEELEHPTQPKLAAQPSPEHEAAP